MSPAESTRSKGHQEASGSGGSHLFVVSNLGQLRQCAAVVRQAHLGSVTVLVLWTVNNEQLRDRLVDTAERYGLVVRRVLLPRSPLDLFPRRIMQVAATYDEVVSTIECDHLWIANVNRHYSHLARLFARSGASLNYFEEGLGTYRQLDDPPYRSYSAIRRVAMLADDVTAACRRYRWRPWRQIRRSGYLILRAVAESGAGRVVNRLATRGLSDDFYELWTSFDRAVVSFPDAVDRRLVNAREVIQLVSDSDPTDALAADALAWLAGWPDRPNRHVPLYLSQIYDVDPAAWADAVASAIARQGWQQVTVKFHPREPASARTALFQAMAARGVATIEDEALDRWPAEALLASGISDEVVGLTSSTLLYRPGATVGVVFTSIGRTVLETLCRDERVTKAQLERFRFDLELFERVHERLGT